MKILAALLLLSTAPAYAQEIPAATALPVELNATLDSNKVASGQAISAIVSQDVPLPSGARIRSGSHVNGRVLQVGSKPGSGAFVRLRFDQVHAKDRDIQVSTSLRALASPYEVQEAQLPKTGPVERDAAASWITVQVGEDVVYRGGGHVMHDSQIVGDPVKDGVVSVLLPVPKPGCENGSGDRRLAVWVFASSACGTYGFGFLEISHAGNAEPVGEIVLQSKKTVHLGTGTALLLITN